MSEINEKIITKFFDMMEKVNSLELQVQSIAKDHNEIRDKTLSLIDTLKEQVKFTLDKQNDLVTSTNDNIINRTNDVLKDIDSRNFNLISKQVTKEIEKLEVYNIREDIYKIKNEFNKINKTVNLFNSFLKNIEATSIPEPCPVLDILIEDTPFSVRTINCLRVENINTVKKLIEKTKRELLCIPNFGMKALGEVRGFLIEKGLSLKQ